MEYLNEYKKWCTSDVFDEETKKELLNIKDNKKEIEDRFYKELEFGTAGLRGIIGAGTNRMNIYTVGKATQGLANYIKKNNGEERGVAIAFDSRHMSKEFSEEAALILNANGIKTYLFDSLRPVPELSFAVRELNCIAGIMITASHNPPKYNGYKVYWEDGHKEIKKISKAEGERKKLYTVIGKEIDEKYMEALEKLVLNPEIIKKQKDLKIVYTPLHGTGNIPVKTILNKLGFEKVYIVKEEEKPNGDFPTVDYPNPEDPKAFKLALKLAKEKDADIVLATDPDADRLGVYAKDSKTGEYKSFTGNMSGLLIAEYELSQKRERNNIPQNGILIKTIVSSNLADAISKKYNIQLKEVLTGFKYIGEQIKIFEKTNENTYLFGFEESYGCLIGTHARDKDGIAAVMALCEAAAYYKEKGFTLWDQMINIYEEYGYYKEDLLSITLEGVEGASKIKEMMENLRNNIPTRIGEYKVEKFRDYKTEKIINMETKEEEKTGLPESNVLYFDLENDFWVCVRPSGTEPKIKFYVGVKGSNIEDAEIKVKKLKEDLNEIIEM
mgnify:FL=1